MADGQRLNGGRKIRMADFTADDLATVLEIVLAQAEEVERLTARAEHAERVAREADARARRLEQKLDEKCADLDRRLMGVEVPLIRDYHAGPAA